jgi:hypothetical protein
VKGIPWFLVFVLGRWSAGTLQHSLLGSLIAGSFVLMFHVNGSIAAGHGRWQIFRHCFERHGFVGINQSINHFRVSFQKIPTQAEVNLAI